MNPFELLWSLGDIKSFADHVKAADGGDPWGFAGAGADVVGTAQSFLGQAGETPVIEAGLITITLMNWMCGFGDSEKGDRFGDGGSKFNEVIDKLKSASPDGTWQGSGSDAYAGQNEKQQSRAKTMVDADFDMNQIISCEANQLSGTRDILDHAGTVLGYAILPAIAAMRIPVWGWEISLGIQLGAVGGTVPVCQAEMIQMAARALENAESVQKAIDRYNSANPDPNLRTHDVGLWGAPRSGSAEPSPHGTPGEVPPVNTQPPNTAPPIPPSPAPHASRNPAPTVPSGPGATAPPIAAPTVPSVPAPAVPSSPAPVMPSSSGSTSQSSAAPVPSAPASAAGGAGSLSTGSAPSSHPSPAGHQKTQFAAKPSAPQATSGTAAGERAPVKIKVQSEGGDAPNASAASTRTGENDVR
jgi:hypothetical protein